MHAMRTKGSRKGPFLLHCGYGVVTRPSPSLPMPERRDLVGQRRVIYLVKQTCRGSMGGPFDV